jgi:2,3-bisphosphoglycerate-independent phosphoglycerate mutase
MVGHTGNIPAAVSAIKTVDSCLKIIATEILKNEGTVLVTADHGNADVMFDNKKKQIIKEHSMNPFLLLLSVINLKKQKTKIVLDKLKISGSLADVAPTILKQLTSTAQGNEWEKFNLK